MSDQPAYTEEELQERLQAFETAWRSGQWPEIDDFLHPPRLAAEDGSGRDQLLVELIMLDVECRWRGSRSGRSDEHGSEGSPAKSTNGKLPDRPRLEDYVKQYPELGSPRRLPIALIADEYRVRQRWGDQPDRDEYISRFLGRADDIRAELDRVDQLVASQARAGELRTRCCHCHNSIRIPDDTSLSDINCPSCGSSFSIVRDEAADNKSANGMSIGHFELVERLGTGAFGTVWKARDTELDRTVAVKIAHRGKIEPSCAEQFEREARAAAQLAHPNIVCVHEVGRDGDAIFIVSDLVTGTSMSEWLRVRRPSAREAATLCVAIAQALHHAHEAGIVHRDLKPQNIVIDDEGQPHLMDFGLARREAGEVTMTCDGQVLGTPAYMSPELARGEAHHVDRRSDVYSLGVLLFQLITGELPFRGNVRMVLHQVVHDEPPSPRRLNSSIPRDLETICLKCMEKEPAKRYASAHDVADELRRFLRDEPIQARPITRWASTWRWCKRKPLVAGLVASLIVVFLSGFAGVTSQWVVAHRQWIRAEQEATRANQEAERHRRLLYVSDIAKIAKAWESGSVGVALEMLARHVPRPGEDDLRAFEWFHLWKRCQPSLQAATLEREPWFAAFTMAVSPNGQLLAAAGGPGTVIIWDLRTREILRKLEGHEYTVIGLAFSPDDRLLASSSWDGNTFLWNVDTGERVARLPGYNGVGFSPRGGLLAVCEEDRISVWNVSNLTAPQSFFKARATRSVAFSSDGSILAWGEQHGEDSLIRLWSVVDGQPLDPPLKGHSGSVDAVNFSPEDGALTLVSSSADKTVRIWDVATRTQLQKCEGHSGDVASATFSPDGRTVASGSFDGTAMLWDVSSGRRLDTIRGHDSMLYSVAFGAGGHTLYTGSADGTVKRWELAAREKPVRFEGNVGPNRSPIAFSPSGKLFAAARRESDVTLWDPASGKEVATFPDHKARITDLAFSPDGRAVVSATTQKTKLWDVETPHVIHEWDGAKIVAFSPDGKVLAAGGRLGIRLWDTASGKLRLEVPTFGKGLLSLAFSPDGKILAVGGRALTKRNFILRDARTGEELAAPEGHLGAVDAIAFSPDGKIVVTGGFLGEIKLWNTTTWQELVTTIEGRHVAWVNSVAFSPDGKTLASGSKDGTIKLWHVATGGHLLTLTGHEESVESVAFSPDGKALASSSGDGTIRIWPAATEEELAKAGW